MSNKMFHNKYNIVHIQGSFKKISRVLQVLEVLKILIFDIFDFFWPPKVIITLSKQLT